MTERPPGPLLVAESAAMAVPKPRLLILDDDVLVGQTIARIARQDGAEVSVTSHADAFFAAYDALDPTHIALDLVMPRVDGIEVLRRLSERGCAASIIITSGVGSRILDAARRSAEEHGLAIAGVLSKPFSSSALRDLLTARGERGLRSLEPSPRQTDGGFAVTEQTLGDAIEAQQIKVAYQPKVACVDRGLAGFEALARWHHPDAGVITPDRFIAAGEDCGLIDRITTQIADQALAWFATNCAGGPQTMSINLSARSLTDLALADRTEDLCRARKVAPERVILELTETGAMADPVTSLDVLTRLRMKGFLLSLDDFGVGYSSLVQLARLPFSELKVDRTFVTTAMHSEESRKIIGAVVSLGHGLGLTVTAEGVEDEDTLEFLRLLGCDHVQGYLIARPMNGDSMRLWMRHSNWCRPGNCG